MEFCEVFTTTRSFFGQTCLVKNKLSGEVVPFSEADGVYQLVYHDDSKQMFLYQKATNTTQWLSTSFRAMFESSGRHLVRFEDGSVKPVETTLELFQERLCHDDWAVPHMFTARCHSVNALSS